MRGSHRRSKRPGLRSASKWADVALDLKPVQVRLNEDAYEALAMLAAVEDKDLGEKAREILSRALLGEVHSARVMATRFARAVGTVKKRKDAVSGSLDLE